MHGCIPVIISERLHPPFGEMIQWTEIAIWLHEDEIPNLPEILNAVPESEVRYKHAFSLKSLKQASAIMIFLKEFFKKVVYSIDLKIFETRIQKVHPAIPFLGFTFE